MQYSLASARHGLATRLLSFTACLILPAPFVIAQEATTADASGIRVTDGGNRMIYEPTYFERFNVITASDQLERIPGIEGLLRGGNAGGGDQRGFGNTGDQVLINGRRVSGKSNDVDSVLDRIQARQVIRIEVIRGTVEGLDVRSEGRVVNVVLAETLSSSYGAWQAGLDNYGDGHYGGSGELSYSGDISSLSYMLSLEADLRKNLNRGTDLFHTPGNVLFERQSESSLSQSQETLLSGNTSYTFMNGDILNLNFLYEEEDNDQTEISSRFDIDQGQSSFTRNLLIGEQELSSSWELGGDYEHVFNNGHILTGLFVYSTDDSDELSAVSFENNSPPALDNLQFENSESTEQIIRGTYQWSAGDNHTLESGAELAINEVSEKARLQENVDGELTDIPLFNQESTIQETRIEAFLADTWQLRTDLMLESSLDLELSEIEQQGFDVSRARDFFFAKPRVVLRYDLNNQTQLRLRVERTVDQLDFGDFVASFTNDDNRFNVINAGNPELEPEQAWEYELTYERRLADDLGFISITAEYNDIRDRNARVPLVIMTEDGQEEYTAPGNIDEAYSTRLTLESSLRLDRFGWTGAVVDASLEFADSQVIDPFTNTDRNFNFQSDYEWSLGFRHDTSWRGLSYGMDVSDQSFRRQFDLDYWQEFDDEPEVELFAEIQLLDELTLRLAAEDILQSENDRQRLQYIGNRGNNLLERREFRTSRSSREIRLSLQGIF